MIGLCLALIEQPVLTQVGVPEVETNQYLRITRLESPVMGNLANFRTQTTCPILHSSIFHRIEQSQLPGEALDGAVFREV